MQATQEQRDDPAEAIRSGVIRIGARSSPLAQHHAHRLADAVLGVNPGLAVEVVAITTKGDTHQGPLHEVGGKGVFVAAIDRALQDGRIDIAAHCAKDIPGDVPEPDGLVIGAYLPRDDPRDCLVLRSGTPSTSFADLPEGARIATSAVRRKAQLLRLRPDLVLTDLRGNIGPRLARLDAGDLDAIVLARCALTRTGHEHRVSQVFEPEELYPAIGAGLLSARCRASGDQIIDLLARIDDPAARLHSTAERAYLRRLRGNCRSPVAGHCGPDGAGGLTMSGMVFGSDGRTCLSASRSGPAADAEALGYAVAEAVLAKGARNLIDAAGS